jgi:hypothetical protein
MMASLFSALLMLAASDGAPAPPAQPSGVPAAAQMPPNVRLVESVMRRRALHHLESKGGLRLPRMNVFVEGMGHTLYTVGWDPNIPGRLDKAVQRGHSLNGRPHLPELLDDLDNPDGTPLVLPPLRRGDVVVVLYWAPWCGPCGTAMTELRKVMAADTMRSYVWITVEADPVRQKLQRQTIR